MAKTDVWAKQTTNIKNIIKASHDPLKEWHPDPLGYFLIRINKSKKRIEAGFVTYKHIITKQIYGSNAVELYHTIVREKMISRLEHAAYLGKELYKVELCLRYGKEYRQEFPLHFPEVKEVVKLKIKSWIFLSCKWTESYLNFEEITDCYQGVVEWEACLSSFPLLKN